MTSGRPFDYTKSNKSSASTLSDPPNFILIDDDQCPQVTIYLFLGK